MARLSKAELFVVAGAALLALPVVLFPYPPMTDLPHHEALVALMRHFGDASLFPPGLYEWNLGQPNQGFHLLAWPLSYVFGVTLACKIVAAAAVASVPLGALRFARHVGATPIAALALAPIAVGWLFTWGFVNNLLALGIFFALLPLVDALASDPIPRRIGLACIGALALYFAHELVMFVYVGAIGLLALVRAPSVRGFFARCIPAAVAMAMALAQIRLQEKLKTETVRMVPNVWLSFAEKMRDIPATLVGTGDMTLRIALFLLTLGFVLLLAMARLRASEAARAEGDAAAAKKPLRERLAAHRFEWLAAATFGLYLVGPFTFNGAMLVHERFLAPAFGIVAIMAGVGVAPRLPAMALAATLPTAPLFALLPWFGDAARNYHDMEALFARIPIASSVAAVDLDKDQGGRPFTVASGLSRVLVRRGGRVLYSFAESTVAPVRIAPAHQWNEPSSRIMFDNTKFRPQHDLTRFRFLLVHARAARRLEVAAAALEHEARLVDTAGEWALFESTLPVVPLTAPDAALPQPRPETLGRRMWFLEHPSPAHSEPEGEAKP